MVSIPFSAQNGANQFLFTAWVYLEQTSNHLEINISSANGTERLIIVIGSKVRVSNIRFVITCTCTFLTISEANYSIFRLIVISDSYFFLFFSRTIETSQQLTSENWHVIALVMDNDDSKLYIDGQICFQSSIKFELQTKMKLTLTGMESSPLQIVT